LLRGNDVAPISLIAVMSGHDVLRLIDQLTRGRGASVTPLAVANQTALSKFTHRSGPVKSGTNSGT
jgi:hypothetical protein